MNDSSDTDPATTEGAETGRVGNDATDFPAGLIGYPEPFSHLCVKHVNLAQRSVRIFSPDLDRDVYDNDELAHALAGLARRSRYSAVKILICDSRPLVKRGHRLLALSRRLSSSISIQKLEDHPDLPKEGFILCDDNVSLLKPLDSDRDAIYDPDSRARVKPYLERFDELWTRSRPDSELRVLGL